MSNQPFDPTQNFLKAPTLFKAKGLGDVTLETQPESRAGGMGCVYFQTVNGKPYAFKLYHNPKQAQRDNLAKRLQMLTVLDHDSIVGPRGLIDNQKGEFVGYWMPSVQGEELTRLLTMQYQTSQGIRMDDLKKFIEKMREAVLFAHSKEAIMGDPNERNYIFKKQPRKGLVPWFLDVDNWGLANNFGPVAVAPHIQDHQHKGPLNQNSDWYGMGIIWFWILTCTHPYGGRLSGFDHRDAEHFVKRMKAQASIFRQGVKMPPATRSLAELPSPFLDWCGRVFEHGERSVPPSMFDTGTVPAAAVTTKATADPRNGTATIISRLLSVTNDPVLRTFGCGLALTRSGKMVKIEGNKEVYHAKSPACQVVQNGNHYLIGDYNDDGSVLLACVDVATGNRLEVSNQYGGDKVWIRDNRLYVIAGDQVSELKLRPAGNMAILTAAQTWTARNITWLDEVAIQILAGQAYVWLPFKEGAYTSLRVKEMDGLVPVASRASGSYAAITAQGRGGHSYKVEIKFAKDYKTCEVKKATTPYLQLNMTLLDKGMGAAIEDDGELTLFYPFTAMSKPVKDSNIHTGMLLSSVGNKILFLLNGAVWHLKTT